MSFKLLWFVLNFELFLMFVGLRFAGTRDGRSQELLYDYAVYFLNEVCPLFWCPTISRVCQSVSSSFLYLQIKSVSVSSKHSLPKGLSNYVDRGTLETCLHLIVLSLCVVSGPFYACYLSL